MAAHPGTSPLTQRELIDEYFMEHRVQIIDLAAFLDRLQRAAELDAQDDFRIRCVYDGLAILTDGECERARRVQMAFSDRDSTLLASLDRKSARGAHDARD